MRRSIGRLLRIGGLKGRRAEAIAVKPLRHHVLVKANIVGQNQARKGSKMLLVLEVLVIVGFVISPVVYWGVLITGELQLLDRIAPPKEKDPLAGRSPEYKRLMALSNELGLD
jgi:hypothetical protein